jgi:hypothetical protein
MTQIDKARECEMMYILILTLPKITCAQRKPSYLHLDQYTTADTLTSWYIQDLLVVKEDIEEYKIQIPNPMTLLWNSPSYFANPYVNSNPRCPSKGVWDVLYYGTYITTVFLEGESVLLRFWAKIASPRFLAVSLLRFHLTHTVCLEPVLKKDFSESRTWLYPKIWMWWSPNCRCNDPFCKLSIAWTLE